MTAGAIASNFDTARPTVSKHLQILTACELLKQEQNGREIYYQINANKMKEVANQSEFQALLSSNDRVIVDFFATWCGPCVRIAPFLEGLASSHGDIAFVKVDVDKNTETSTFASIKAMPTFIAYLHGKELDRIQGASEEKLTDLVKRLLSAK